jgi:SAM-dependent methyltransferase
MALLDWELQQQALKELARILKIGGHLVLFEGTVQGLEKLNLLRGSFGLNSIDGSGKEGLFTLKFDEVKLNKFLQSDFELITESGFGTYYFLTRVFYPLHIAPNKPVFDNEFGGTARLFN